MKHLLFKWVDAPDSIVKDDLEVGKVSTLGGGKVSQRLRWLPRFMLCELEINLHHKRKKIRSCCRRNHTHGCHRDFNLSAFGFPNSSKHFSKE